MSNWELQTEDITVEKNGKQEKVKISKGFQEDEVGNKLQKSGAIVPKACQNCKKEFKSEQKRVPIKQKVPFYSCQDCKFESPSGDQSLEHMWLENHKLKKTKKDRIASFKNIIEGEIPHIKQIFGDNNELVDVKVLCSVCENGNSSN